MLQVRLLGQFDVRRDSAPILIPSRAAQSLLAYLLLTAGTLHRREKLAGVLWPDSNEENARKNLRHELWRLRKAIELKTPGEREVPALLVDEISVGFNAQSDYWLDVSFVQKALPKQVSADQLIETLALYRGELLPGFYSDWVVLERERVHAVLEQKMARLLELLVEEKRWQEALEWGERWIALGQTPEPAYRALMIAHSALGNRSQVASVYERCVQAMRNDLGVEPSEQTRVVFQRLSKGEKIPEVAQAEPSPPPQTKPPPETRNEPSSAPLHASLLRARPLPVPLTSFIGREHEIEQVRALLSTTRLLTLIGAGGIGKTRLAIQLARQLSSQYEDRVCWVDLVALADPALVPQAVADAMGARQVPNVPLSETLAQALCTRQALLVLDNCEHLIAACAQLAESLLGACGSLKILTTSREALGISGETVWRVPSLSLPEPEHLPNVKNLEQSESVRLFEERAITVKPDFAVTKENTLAIARICLRLDGIPLAIELAAARVKALTLQQIAARLDDRFNLLTKGSRTALLRHQTLRATIDWSYDLLSEHERILFRRLSVFAGGWTLEAAESVCSGDGLQQSQVLELLSRLVDKSLVIAEEQDRVARYRMLETVRQYAYEKLVEAGEADRVRDRHLEFFVTLAEESEPKQFGPEQVSWFSRLDTEIGNLRAAVEWSMADSQHKGHHGRAERTQAGLRLVGALAWFFISRYHREASELLKQILASEGAAPPTAARAKALNAAGFQQWALNNFDVAHSLLEESVTISRELGDRSNLAWALLYLGAVVDGVGDYISAQSFLEESLAIAHELGDVGRVISGVALAFLGDGPWFLGDVQRAQRLYEDSIVILRDIEDKNFLAYSVRRMGYIALHQGNPATAVELFKESLTHNHAVGDQIGVVACVAALSAARAARGETIPAVQLFGAVDGLLVALKSTLLSSDRIEHDRYLLQVRARLDPGTLEVAWAEGRAMTMEQAIEYALKQDMEHEPATAPSQEPPPRSPYLLIVSPIFVGRAEKLAALERLIAEVHGGRGRVALIQGEAGIGKSRLVSEARARAAALDWLILQGNCFEHDTALPYAPLLDLVRTFCATRSPEELARAFGASASVLKTLLPELATCFPDLAPAPALEPEQEKHRLFESLAQFLFRLSARQSTLVVVEDLHWSDGTSFEFLFHLARRIVSQPILLLLTYRSDEPNANLGHFLAEIDRERLATELTLEPLSVDEVDAMLRAILRLNRPVGAESLKTIFALTEGNPFFVEEVLNSLITAGDIFYHDDIWERQPTRELHIPRGVQDTVQRRVKQLSEKARLALTMAAVAGRRFDFALLQELMGIDEQDLSSLIKELVAARLVVEDSSEQFSFRHALTREAVSATLLARERQTLHRTIGETLERMYADSVDTHVEELAYHFHTAGVWDKAGQYSQHAGERARAIYALPEALTHLTRAMDASQRLSRTPPFALLRARGEVHETLGHFEQARADLEAGLELARAAGDRRAEWQALLALSFLWENRDYRKSRTYIGRALDLAREIDDPDCVARSLNRLSHWHFNRERNVEALAGYQQALALFRSLNDRQGVSETLSLLAEVSYVRGDLIQSAAYYEEAIAHFRGLDDRRGLVHALAMLPLRLRMDTEVLGRFDPEELFRANETALQIAREIGWRAGEITALGILAECLTSTGDHARALEAGQATLAMARDIDHPVQLARGHWVLGDAYLGIYALNEAESHLQLALEIALAVGSANFEHHATLSLASVYQLRNDLPRAQDLIQKDIHPWHAEQSQHERDSWASWSELKLAQGDAASALQTVEQLISSARNVEGYGSRSIPRLSHLRGQALAALGRLNEAEVELHDAMEVARAQGRRPLLWHIHQSYGMLLQARGQSERATREVAAARGIIEELANSIPNASQRQNLLAYTQSRLAAGLGSTDLDRGASSR